jgi:hypothetical protein
MTLLIGGVIHVGVVCLVLEKKRQIPTERSTHIFNMVNN